MTVGNVIKNPSGNKDLGTITTNGTTSNINVESYKTASVTVNVQPSLQTKTVSASTAAQNVTPDSGYYGLSKVTVNAAAKQTKTVSASTSAQEVTPDSGYYGLSKVTVNAATKQAKTISPTTSQQTVSPDSGYYGLSSVTVNAIQTQTKSATPSTTAQTITPDSGKYLSSVSVGAISTQEKSATPSTSAQNITPDSGKYLTKVAISAIQTQEKSVTPSTTAQNVTPDSGKYLTKVSVGAIATETKTVTSSTTAQTVTPSSGKYLSSVTVNGIAASSALGNATAADVAQGKTFSSAAGILVTGTASVSSNVYGAIWTGGSDPAWIRTDKAANFSDPNPYYAGMATTPSSPFDSIMPWAGIRRVSNSAAGELVEIPKFWYKWTRSGTAMMLQIANEPVSGFYVSPAHADRGDGVGERDYVYVGRYHCSTSDYKSASGVKPKASITRATARTAIHNLGSNVWQWDFALWWTINMLYLVEFANWNSQAMIGYNGGNSSSTENSGASDTMPYHTGTMKSNRTTYGVGCQYRYLEDLWGNVRDWLDGIYFVNDSNIYAIKNPSDFSDNTNGTLVGNCGTGWGIIKSWTTPTAVGYEYALYPASYVDGAMYSNSYVTDVIYEYTNSGSVLFTGGAYEHTQEWGKFFLNKSAPSSWTSNDTGSRLMVLPSSQLT